MVPRETVIFSRESCYIFRLSLQQSQQNKQTTVRATTAELYPGRDIFVFEQGHVTKNQPITVLVLLSESLGILLSYASANGRVLPGFYSVKQLGIFLRPVVSLEFWTFYGL